MKIRKKNSKGLSRRDLLKASGLALGGIAAGGMAGTAALAAQCETNECNYPVWPPSTQEYTYPRTLKKFTMDMQPTLKDDEMRITFLGTAFPPTRKTQQMMSIFVEVGPWVPDPNGGFGKATDSFVFDCGAGAVTNYGAMGIAYSRMDKVFITHLHGDHMSDLTAIYCFGPANDRHWPLYVWGQSRSKVPIPGTDPAQYYEDGTNDFCDHFRKAMRWHSESFSFLPTTYPDYPVPTKDSWGTPCDLVPVGDDANNDGFGLVPIELDWTKTGLDAQGNPNYDNIAYSNSETGVTITHFPVIHCRQGSMGYKLEWKGLSMIYTSDTRPEKISIQQAKNGGKGVDVFIHEMILPPELLAMKNAGLKFPDYDQPGFSNGVENAANVEASSHTPQGAYGYLLSQIDPKPKLAVIAHFPVANDTIKCAMNSVQEHFPDRSYPKQGKDLIWSTDLMVLKVKKGSNGGAPKIEQMMGRVSDYTFGPPQNFYKGLSPAKYSTPTEQLDLENFIDSGDTTYCDNGY